MMSPSSGHAALLLLGQSLVAVVAAAANATIQLEPPAQVPSDASAVVSPTFLGWAVECKTFPVFTEAFSQNIFAGFANRTGAPIVLRIGGTSEDHSNFDLSLNKISTNTTDDGLQSNITLGAPWFEGFGRLSAAVPTKYIVHVPLARRNRTNAVKFTRQVLKSMDGAEDLHALQIGNEPDLYVPQGWRGAGFTVGDYVDELATYMDLVGDELPAGRVFQVWDASNARHPFSGFGPFLENLTQKVNMSRVKTVGQHYYQATGEDTTLQGTLLNHTDTVTKSRVHFEAGLRHMKKYTDIEYSATEVGSSIQNGGGQHAQTISNSLATAVWTVDWMLTMMTMNVDRVHMQQGKGFVFNAWQGSTAADGTPPHVQAGFFGHVLVADFLGVAAGTVTTTTTTGTNNTNNTSTTTGTNTTSTDRQPLRVKEVATGHAHVTAYGGYVGGALQQVALVDLRYYSGPPSGDDTDTDASASARPPSTTVRIATDFPADVTSVAVRRVAGGASDAVGGSGITYAGLNWTASGRPEVADPALADERVDVDVADGSVVVRLGATEAALLFW
ncbi:hypothetical protein GGR56DRAFT_601331 [Xylariaceae sp. FL0804]|nr:hypothetical protein GGR56DRAFT_601331 [Xylariaceae sp. FL0804]